MSRKILIDLDFTDAGARIVGLQAAAEAGQPVTFEQLQSLLEGLSWKSDVRVASTANINLSAPGATIDGVAMANGDRFLAKDQTDASENGIRIWNGAATPATRAADMSASAEFNTATVNVVEGDEGGGTCWRQTAVDPVVDTDDIVFTSFSGSAPAASETTAGILEIATQGEVDAGTDGQRAVTPETLENWERAPKRNAGDAGDGSATSFTITHNLGTRDVIVAVRRNSGAYDYIECDVGATTVNTVTLVFAQAPASGQFRVIILA
jgi:hypothetical protein